MRVYLRLLRTCIICFLLFSFPFHAISQQKISGKIISESQQPVAGATIYLKGGGSSTVTDGSGRFIIEADPSDTLVVSNVGFVTQFIKAGEANSVILKQDTKNLSEVVVTALELKGKKNL